MKGHFNFHGYKLSLFRFTLTLYWTELYQKVMTWWWWWWGVVDQAIIEPPQLTLFNSVLDWVVVINIFIF